MKRIFSMALCLVLLFSLTTASFDVQAADDKIITPATGYRTASDVQYKEVSGHLANWGARGEDCVFLSTYAQNFYTGSYTFDSLNQNAGGTSHNNAPQSALYSALKSMMTAKHSHITSYGETRYLFRYTDCLKNDSEHISSFYSGKQLNGAWDSAATWNREHTWPNSKGLGGSDEDDIMMLRPTWVSENSSRGNTAYGEGSSYYDPGVSVRGDCARIALYVYVRWGNTGKMWGSSGEIQNVTTLLRWMEEDPVDTWEMGRNDAVQDITGTRNVFVDYPEFAWILFGQDVPNTVSTPSGIAKNGTSGSGNGGGNVGTTTTTTTTKNDSSCAHTSKKLANVKEATCGADGYDGDKVCSSCGEVLSKGQVISATGKHSFGDWTTVKEPTATENGSKQRVCSVCKLTETAIITASGEVIPVTTTTGAPTTTTTVTDAPTTQPSADNDTVPTTHPTQTDAATDPGRFPLIPVILAAAAVVVIGVTVVVILVVKKKKKSV